MIYRYQCDRCGVEREVTRPVARRDSPLACGATRGCEGQMRRRFVPQDVQVLKPGHFMAHTHTTGLKETFGSHPDIHRRRWNRPGGI